MEPRHDRIHCEDVVLDIGDGVGALIIYSTAEGRGREIEVGAPGSRS